MHGFCHYIDPPDHAIGFSVSGIVALPRSAMAVCWIGSGRRSACAKSHKHLGDLVSLYAPRILEPKCTLVHTSPQRASNWGPVPTRTATSRDADDSSWAHPLDACQHAPRVVDQDDDVQDGSDASTPDAILVDLQLLEPQHTSVPVAHSMAALRAV